MLNFQNMISRPAFSKTLGSLKLKTSQNCKNGRSRNTQITEKLNNWRIAATNHTFYVNSKTEKYIAFRLPKSPRHISMQQVYPPCPSDQIDEKWVGYEEKCSHKSLSHWCVKLMDHLEIEQAAKNCSNQLHFLYWHQNKNT